RRSGQSLSRRIHRPREGAPRGWNGARGAPAAPARRASRAALARRHRGEVPRQLRGGRLERAARGAVARPRAPRIRRPHRLEALQGMSMDERELEGRVALVTGAARNIGRAIAASLARAGAAVVVNANTSREAADEAVRAIEAAGGRALAHLADVTDERAVAAMVEAALAKFGRLDILVNNAAIRDVVAIDDIDLAAWRRVTGVILDGAFICTKACLAPLRASGAGAIVNIGGMS